MTDTRAIAPNERMVASILDRLHTDQPAVNGVDHTIPTGFEPLDHELEGGFRPGQLIIIGGPPGVGKTVFALQLARNAATHGSDAAFVCYEHDTAQLFGRLLASEIGALGDVVDINERESLRSVIRNAMAGTWDSTSEGVALPRVRAAMSRIETYADRLLLVGAGRRTELGELGRLAEEISGGGVMVVDYLQKVPAGDFDFGDRVAVVTEELKDIALRDGITVIALSSAGGRSLEDRRIGLPSLEGAASIAYDADVALILNEKSSIVSKVHVNFDPERLKVFHQYLVVTIEKNRRGPTPIELEFKKMLHYFRLETKGRYVTEKLIDDVLYLD